MKRFALAALAVILFTSSGLGAEPAPRIKGLFLGDPAPSHHHSADRAAQLIPVMAARGIDLVFTERVSDLNAENLSKYDVLVLYANTERISPSEEKALFDFVASGKGFVPLHCASYCFLNSAACTALIGARFQRHGTGEFETIVVAPDHPIMKGFHPFSTWDETYVHTMHNPKDRIVLQERAEGSGREPWTWVRTHGKGRVFYTAYGHDVRTWQQPGFQDLVERGIRWASGIGPVFDSRPSTPGGGKPFTFQPAQVPMYVPKAAWGTNADPVKRMQNPLEPAESMKHVAVPRGFHLELFTAEPEVAKPIALAWDHRGRLWVAETFDYPNERKPAGEGRDRIKICEDTDGDGRADKFTIFAEKLSIPTSIAFANGGVVVHQLPDTLFFKDTDGDDKADERRVLLHGWGTGDTHAGPSNLRYGLDNQLYGMVGYSSFNGVVGGKPVAFQQGFYRFKPDGSTLEYLRATNNNSWGVGFSEEGILFGSTANGVPSVYMPIANKYYEDVRGWSPTVLRSIAESFEMYPITEKVRQVDHFGGFTAAAGHALYTARSYPPYYWNSTAFVTEPTGHLASTFTLERVGADFKAWYGWNIAAGNDEWFAPIAAEVGPDGQVWIIDWYNFIVQHNPTPRGFKTGKGNAYETPLRDKRHGRIYRVVYDGAKPYQPIKLDPSDATRLVETLKNDNMFWRLTAQRLLVERGKADVAPALVAMVGDKTVDGLGLNAGATHALWTLHGLGQLDGSNQEALAAATAALGHPAAGVRRNAAQVLPRDQNLAGRVVDAGLLRDPDAQVKLAALLTLADAPPDANAAEAIVEELSRGSFDNDRWLADAAIAAAAKHDVAFLRALASKQFPRPLNPLIGKTAARVAEHFARGKPVDAIGGVLKTLPKADEAVAQSIIEGLSSGWPRDAAAHLDAEADAALATLCEKLPAESQARLVELGARLGSKALNERIAAIAKSLLATVQDDDRLDAARVAAAHRIIALDPSGDAMPKALLALVTPRSSPALATGLIDAVAASRSPVAGRLVADSIPSWTPTARAEAFRALIARSDWTGILMQAFEEGKLRASDLTLDQQQALAAHRNQNVAARARKLLAQGGGLPDADRQKVIDSLLPIVTKGGDPARGKLVFTQQCAKCHTHAGAAATGRVGPELTGMAAHPREELIVHILDPSRSVEGNFIQYAVATTDGRTLTGLLASETRTSIELLDAEGKSQILQRSDIEEIKTTRKSLMPEGFEKQVPPASLADLLAFLTQRGKYTPLDLSKVATVVSTEGMFYGTESQVERLIFEDWNPKTFDGVPFQLVNPRGTRVRNAIMLNSPNGEIPPRMPKSLTLPCHASARAIHFLSGVSGWGYNGGEADKSVSMIVRLHYADGKVEDHKLLNGVHFADYIRPIDVPASKLAYRLRGRQLRYFAVVPDRKAVIETIDLVKGDDLTAPVVMAVTVENNE